MKKTTGFLLMGIMVMCSLMLFAGPAAAAILSNGDFELCTGTPDLRDLNAPDMYWYESRGAGDGGDSAPLTLTSGIGGNGEERR